MTWHYANHAILRMAGFPLELTSHLDSSSVEHLARAMVDTRDDRKRAARDRKNGLPDATSASAAEAAVTSADAAFSAALDDFQRASALDLRKLFRGNTLLSAALMQSNEGAWQRLGPWLENTELDGSWSKTDRKNVDTLALYLQRLCAKNDTASHYGPFALVSFPPHTDTASVARTSTLHRRSLLSRWATREITRVLQSDTSVAGHLPLRRHPGLICRNDEVLVLRFDHSRRHDDLSALVSIDALALGDVELELLRRAMSFDDDTFTRSELLGVPSHTASDLQDALDALVERGVLQVGPFVPYGAEDPFPSLLAHLPHDSDRAQQIEACARAVRDWGERAEAFDPDALAAANTAVTDIIGEPHEVKPAASFYSDRSFVHEECVGPITELTFPEPVRADIESTTQPILDLFMARPCLVHQELQAAMNDWFWSISDGPECSFDRFVSHCLDDAEGLRAVAERVAAKTDTVNELIARSLDVDTTRAEQFIDPDAVSALLADGAQTPALCNPDVMISATSLNAIVDGHFDLVIGDLHADEDNLTHSLFGPYLATQQPDAPPAIRSLYDQLLEEDEEFLDITLMHRNKTFIRQPIGLPDLVLEDAAPRGVQTVSPADLSVRSHEGRLRLRRQGSDHFQRLVTLPLAWTGVAFNPFSAFGFPQRDGAPLLPLGERDHLPRLRLGRAVVQRRTWSIDPRLMAVSANQSMPALVELRNAVDLPARFYVKSAIEPKPVYISANSPHLAKAFANMARKTDQPLVVQEMFPAENGLWLDRGEGNLVTAELRCAAFRIRDRS